MPISTLAFIGFGEAAMTFTASWRQAQVVMPSLNAYDIKTLPTSSPADQQAKQADYQRHRVLGHASVAEAIAHADVVWALVPADQAVGVAQHAATHLAPNAWYFDANSCAPDNKRQSAQYIERVGGRYVDVAIMAPVQPLGHNVPMYIAGKHIDAAQTVLQQLAMTGDLAGSQVGDAAAIKMIRSIFIKGLEAISAECILAACAAGVESSVVASLQKTIPGMDWPKHLAYQLERMTTHGARRAAEMDEVALTIADLALPNEMAKATATWQRRLAGMAGQGDYRCRAQEIMATLARDR